MRLMSECGAMSTVMAPASLPTRWATLTREAVAQRFWSPQEAEDILDMVHLSGRVHTAYTTRSKQAGLLV